MFNNKQKSEPGLFKGVFLAYFVLAFHIILIAALGFLVIFFNGFMQNMIWIFLGTTAVLLTSGYLFFRRLRREAINLVNTLNSPQFKNRPVEISFMGGAASVKLGHHGHRQLPGVESPPENSYKMLPETGRSNRMEELEKLGQLYRDGIITEEEFTEAKKKLLKWDDNI